MYGSSDLLRHEGRPLVLPEPQHAPSLLLERNGVAPVAVCVPLDLWVPVVSVTHGGPASVLGTAVPPAAVDEYGHPAPGENDVGADRSETIHAERVVDAKAQTG